MGAASGLTLVLLLLVASKQPFWYRPITRQRLHRFHRRTCPQEQPHPFAAAFLAYGAWYLVTE